MKIGRQVACGKRRIFGEHHGPMNGILQFADVTWIVVLHERDPHGFGQAKTNLSVLHRVPRQEVRRQFENVVTPLAERRQLELNDIQPVVEIGAERSGRHEIVQAHVHSGHHPGATDPRYRGTDRSEFAGLQHAQQRYLHGMSHRRRFVKQDRAATGGLEFSRARDGRTSVRSTRRAEEFHFQQRFRQRAAIHCDERFAGPGAALMQQTRDYFLARSSLSANEDGRLGIRNAPHQFERARDPRVTAEKRRGEWG